MPIQLPDKRTAYVPTAWQAYVNPSLRHHELDLARPDGAKRALSALADGQGCWLSGSWGDVMALLHRVERRKKGFMTAPPSGGPSWRRREAWKEQERLLHGRLLLVADPDGTLRLGPPVAIPHLLMLLGDPAEANGDLPIVLPAQAAQELLQALETTYPVRALEAELLAPNSVLQPRQQDVYALFMEALDGLRPTLPDGLACLDMGCGSGALTLCMATALAPLSPQVTATDLLPEALATTRLNVARFADAGRLDPAAVKITDGGDLYEPLADARYDLIAFNPPWADAEPRTRLEIARFDPQGVMIGRFMAATPGHLRPGGRLLCFYADNAGPRAVERLLDAASEAGLKLVETASRRIRVAKRWEHLYLYTFAS